MSEPDWPALWRPLRRCGMIALMLLVSFGLWKLAVPEATRAPVSAINILFILVPFSVILPCGLVLPVYATIRLWRAKRRAVALSPIPFLVGGVFGLSLVVEGSWALASLPLLLLSSAALSGYLIVFTRVAPASPSFNAVSDAAPADRDVDTDDPSGYARDVPAKRARR